MRTASDVVIIGAGIIGMSIALQIARRSTMSVTVLDKGMGPGEGSTGASSAVCRTRYSHPEMIELAKAGIGAYRRWNEFLGGPEPRARFNNNGVLWLCGDPSWADTEALRLREREVEAETLDDADLARLFPSINPCVIAPDLEGGTEHDCKSGGRHLFERNGGYMDPVDALQDLISAARQRGVDVRFGADVEELGTSGETVTGVKLDDDETIDCASTILAAGAWCNKFMGDLGLDRWPLDPTRIQIAQIDRPPGLHGDLPVCADVVGGIYFRPQSIGQQIIVGSILAEDELETVDDPDHFATYADESFIVPKLHALEHRLRFDRIAGRVKGYSGLYTINRTDLHPIVGRTPVNGLHVAVGCSGHGFKLAPAIGSLIAKEITGRTLDDDAPVGEHFLAYDREPIKLKTMSVFA